MIGASIKNALYNFNFEPWLHECAGSCSHSLPPVNNHSAYAACVQDCMQTKASDGYNTLASGGRAVLIYSTMAAIGFGAHTAKQGLVAKRLSESQRKVKIITGSSLLALGAIAATILLVNAL